MTKTGVMADRDDTLVFVLSGVTYVPCYNRLGVFVGPGYGRHNFKTYTATELEQAGAHPDRRFLWKRPKFINLKGNTQESV